MVKERERTMLIGMKSIRAYYPRSEKTIIDLITNSGFPARKINGVWEADKEQIDTWRREQILR